MRDQGLCGNAARSKRLKAAHTGGAAQVPLRQDDHEFTRRARAWDT